MAKNKNLIIDFIEKFHADNIYLPTRTVYLGSIRTEGNDEEAGVDYSMAKSVIKNLHMLDSLSHKKINLIMNSPGGDWHHGIAIYDFIKQIESSVYITAYGYARSMTSIILQAGTKRFLSKHCRVMVHDGFEAIEGIPKTVESWAEDSKVTRKMMYQIYLEQIRKKHPRFTMEKIEDMCKCDYIMSGEEAIRLGLADKIIE